MNPPTNFIQSTPFLHVRDLDAAVGFFEGVLGFRAHVRMTDYAYVHRETVGVRIMAHADPADAPRLPRRFTYYIDVRDVDALFAELKPKLDTLPAGDVHGPVNQSYGQREFMVLGPDGGVIVFGQALVIAGAEGDTEGDTGPKGA